MIVQDARTGRTNRPGGRPVKNMTGTTRHPLFTGRPRYTFIARPSSDDEVTTGQTIALMQRYAAEDSHRPCIRAIARQAIADHPALTPPEAIWYWIREHVRLIDDQVLAGPVPGVPDNSEVLVRPADIIRMPEPAGDCDDVSMLISALLAARGIRSHYRTVAEQPGPYSHVYTVATYHGAAVPLDSHGPYPGWELRAKGKARDWEDQGKMEQSTLGLSEFWQGLIKTGASGGLDIVKQRYAQPPPGTYQQTSPGGGSVFFRQQPGAPGYAYPGGSIGIGTEPGPTNLILIAGVALVGLVVIMSLRK